MFKELLLAIKLLQRRKTVSLGCEATPRRVNSGLTASGQCWGHSRGCSVIGTALILTDINNMRCSQQLWIWAEHLVPNSLASAEAMKSRMPPANHLQDAFTTTVLNTNWILLQTFYIFKTENKCIHTFTAAPQRCLKEKSGCSPKTAVQEGFRLHKLPLRDCKKSFKSWRQALSSCPRWNTVPRIP